MRLNRLEIFGFKSFAQKIDIPFDPGITAIVGPNGCGKSNVVEAIRWVLGEQRASAFRSHRMEEVIFSGSGQRKPLGMSEVQLIVDNTNHLLPIDFSEVTVTRRLFRSGESDYLLNKVPCRLLDIQNLLMDTGLGPGAYSVMEQGMVDEIVSEKTDNRRRILEEAAGITKYKLKRRSTWSKLESTQIDLTHLETLLGEAKRQVDYLGRQVKQAQRYQTLKEELDHLEILLGRVLFFALVDQLKPLRDDFNGLQRNAESELVHFTTREAELEKSRLAVTDAEKAQQQVSIELTRSMEDIRQKEGQFIATRERLEAREQFIQRASAEQNTLQEQLLQAQQQRQEANLRLESIQEEYATSQQQLQSFEAEASAANKLFSDSRAALNNEKRQQMDILRQQGELSRQLERQRAERDALLNRAQQLRTELETTATERDQAVERENDAQSRLDTCRQQLAQLQAQQEKAQTNHSTTTHQLNRLEQSGNQINRAIESNQARLNALVKLRSSYEGYSSGVRTLMVDSPHRELFLGVLGDFLEVEPACYRAVEVALGEALEALIAADSDSALAGLNYLKSTAGRAGIFPLSWQKAPAEPSLSLPAFSGSLGLLSDRVQAKPEVAPLVARLLHNTFLVEDLATAIPHIGPYVAQQIRLVSLQGDAVDLCGRVAGGKSDQAEDASVLGRGREMAALRSVLAHEKTSLCALDTQRQGAQLRILALQQRQKRLAQASDQLRETEFECRSQYNVAHSEVSRLSQQQKRLEGESQQFGRRLEELHAGISGQEKQLGLLEEQATQLEARLLQLEHDLEGIENQQRQKSEQLSVMRIERARIVEQTESLRRDTQRLQHIEENQARNIERLKNEITQATEERQRLESNSAEMSDLLKVMHQDHEALAARRDKAQHHWQEVVAQSRQLEEAITKMQRQLNSHRERRYQTELQIKDLENQAEQIKARLRNEQECDIEAMGPAEIDEDFSSEETQRRIDQLRQSIQRMGPVHVGVLAEYEQEKEHYDFQIQQRDDLLAAAEDLKKTLSLIDRRARKLFSETFDQIRQQFKLTFARFFDGGEADLVPEEGADLLEANIDIIARPRGKRLQSINLLSGGERALTAISLLFAIYQVKPSPFCILDEVDAPLDDTNVERFVRVLKEFAKTTQFIMVTHNKISMNAADTLHGVTMPEEGISQLVSVRLGDQILDEAAG